MKKRILFAAMAAMLTFSAVGCGSRDVENSKTVDYKDCATLAEYKGVEVEADRTMLEVSDDDIQREIDNLLQNYSTENQITEGTVKDGDTINLDYSGLLDGVAFSGGTATDTEYTVGGNFIVDLDRGLIGLEVGKKYEIPCTFPEGYSNEELKGKDVIFEVTVNYIVEKIPAEYNNEFVKNVVADAGIEDVSTTDEMTAYIKNSLYENKLLTFNQTKFTNVINKIIDNTEYKSMPEAELEYLQNNVRNNLQNEFNMYGAYYGVSDIESFYKSLLAPSYGYETFDEFVVGYSTEYLKEKMAVTLIAEAEGIVVTDEELQAYGEEYAANSGLESYAALLEQYGEEVADEFEYTLLYEKVYDFLVENSVEI